MKREEIEGPPKELFQNEKGRANDTYEDDDGKGYNEEALRKYQLERLRCVLFVLRRAAFNSGNAQLLLCDHCMRLS